MTDVSDATAREVALMKDRVEVQMGLQRTELERQAAFARSCIEPNERMRPGDVVRMAKNLHAIITSACTAGAAAGGRLTKVMIANAAGKEDGNGKSGALERFTRDPSSEVKGTGRLTQRPAGYLKLALTAAMLSGGDPDRATVDLVQGTRLASGMDLLKEDVEAEHLVMLASAIQGEARRIAEAAGLSWYFDVIERQGLVPDGQDWLADHEHFLWQWQTVPWIDLVTEEVAVFGGSWWPKRPDGTFGERQDKAVWVCRRIGLALAPFGPGKEVRAYFVRRPVVAVTEMPKPRKAGVMLSLSDLMLDDAVVLRMPDEEGSAYHRLGTLRVPDPQAVRGVKGCEPSDFPGDDHEFVEVTPTGIAAVLESGFPDAVKVAADAFRMPKAAFTKSPPGSRAAALEQVLLHGWHSSDDGDVLMGRLEALSRTYVDGLRAWVADQTARIEEAMVRLAGGGR